MPPSLNDPAKYFDHTLLRPDAVSADIRTLCEEAVEYGCAAVCVPPSYIAESVGHLYGSGVAVGTVVGFPLGYVSAETKVFETTRAVSLGAKEIDMVIHLGAAREGLYDVVEEEIRKVVESSSKAVVKVILECAYFNDGVKKRLVECAAEGGAHYVKTSTGFSPGGATLEDVRLLAEASRGRMGVKAAGGIRDWEAAKKFIEAGATRIGTSATVSILDAWRSEPCADASHRSDYP